eukprot:CAMPEP_0202461606 /NCGR_PEP_ID=MMETSP1360-20130828/50092_1 /ASSEMBLY_ACC=CAM_ASM_000848 /TAXON_ID=515479 /ORGANISM="Licmophora paradoxa, Strain CCMP2313" /LENGTH=537 /DNA_ID=CAMNT_0049083719 /DNA_START=66 /DNA_END=1679 /DNA_ORIENTATION=-
MWNVSGKSSVGGGSSFSVNRKRSITTSDDIDQLKEGAQCTIHYKAPETFDRNEEGFCLSSGTSEECVICLCELDKGGECVTMRKCTHSFHKACILDALSKDPKCPICRAPALEPQGKSPSGAMIVAFSPASCEGHTNCGTITITYRMMKGIQKSYHPNPGVPYPATIRAAYLPFNQDGKHLLNRLAYAFSRGLTFMVGTSLTSGAQNQIIWASIHHKTSPRSSPYGWPDGSYFHNCNDELNNLKVPQKEDCPTIFQLGTLIHNRSLFNRNGRARRAFSAVFTVAASPTPTPTPTLTAHSSVAAVSTSRRGQATFSEKNFDYIAPNNVADIHDTYSMLSATTGQCGICNCSLVNRQSVILRKCDHTFHLNCIESFLSTSDNCPTCLVRVKEPRGFGPSGSMEITHQHIDCPGYSSCGTIHINYTLHGGVQKDYHPNPGRDYSATIREAFLPNVPQGKDLARRLAYAFQRGLCFNIGPSLSTGVQSAITWSTIPHKSQLSGGPFGWGSQLENTTYFLQCNQELDLVFVPAAQDCPDIFL